jgi:hypothetical protein
LGSHGVTPDFTEDDRTENFDGTFDARTTTHRGVYLVSPYVDVVSSNVDTVSPYVDMEPRLVGNSSVFQFHSSTDLFKMKNIDVFSKVIWFVFS